MKSFSQFIIEKRSDDIVPLKPDEAAKEKSLLRNLKKKKKFEGSGNTPSRDFSNTPSTNPTSAPRNSNNVNPNTRPPTFAEVEASATQTPQGQKAQSDAIKSGANNTSSTPNKKNGVLNKLKKGAEKGNQRSVDGLKNLLDRVKGKGDARVPDPKKGELGKLYRTNDRVADPNRAGSVKTTDKINQELTAKRAARINPNTGKATKKGVENFAINQQTKGLSNKGDAGKKSLETAKKIASDSSSKAYKDIETKINTSDYAGKRANLASADELKKIKSDIKTSKTIDARVDTGTRSSAPTNIRTRTNKKTLNTSTRKGKLWKKIKPTVKSSSTPNPDLLRRQQMGAAGEDSNVSGSQKLSKTSVKALTKSQKQAIKGDAFSRATSRVTVNTSNPSYLPKSADTLPSTKGVGISWKKFSKKVNSKVKLNSPKLAKVNKFTKNLSPAINKFTTGLNWANTYNTARDRGRSRFGAGLKATATTAAYSKGATVGAGLAAPIPVPGARIAGGIVGGTTLSTATSTAIDKFFPAPGKKKTAVVNKKDKKNTTVITNNKKTNKGSIINKGGIAI